MRAHCRSFGDPSTFGATSTNNARTNNDNAAGKKAAEKYIPLQKTIVEHADKKGRRPKTSMDSSGTSGSQDSLTILVGGPETSPMPSQAITLTPGSNKKQAGKGKKSSKKSFKPAKKKSKLNDKLEGARKKKGSKKNASTPSTTVNGSPASAHFAKSFIDTQPCPTVKHSEN